MHLIKKSLTLIAILMTASVATAQQSYKEMMYDMNYNFYDVVEAAEKYFEKNPTGKGSGYKPYMRWKNENEGKYAPSGDRKNVDHLMAAKTFKKFKEHTNNAAYKTGAQVSSWEELGPYASYYADGRVNGIGRVECFWVNPDNDEELFLGSRSGGFWKTNDGGATWKNTTDFLVASGVNTIAVNPFNYNEILINTRNAKNGTSHGIYRSKDRGNTWEATDFNPIKTDFGFFPKNIHTINYHPRIRNLVIIGTSSGIKHSNNNLVSWTDALNHFNALEIEFHPTSNQIVYAGSNSTKSLLRSTDSGKNFTKLDPIPGFNSTSSKIAVSSQKPNYVWIASSNDGIWKSINAGINFTFVTNPPKVCDGFAVSDVDETKQIYGYVNIYASEDEETFFQSTGNKDHNNVHADLRTAECINGVFYVGTDGYFAKSEDNGLTWIRLNENETKKKENGTAIRENYSLSISQAIDGVMIGGSQDNGTAVYSNSQWLEYVSSDGMESIIHPLNEKWMVGSTQYGGRRVTKNGPVYPFHYAYHNKGDWEAPILFDPNNHMKLYNFTEELHVSFDFENNWEYVSTPSTEYIQRADIAYNNSNFIVVSTNNVIKLSDNGGMTWKDISYNLELYGISDITFNPKNDSTIIVTSNRHGDLSNKIAITNNLGKTWKDITFDLRAMPIRDVVIDCTEDNNIYIGAEIGVYTMPMNGSWWSFYNKDLPNVTINELKINHGTNELYAATWGRGFWKTDLVGRSNYPKILTTRITNTPTETTPEVGSHQIVTSTIEYADNLTNVEVRWSVNNLSFSNAISMTYNPGNKTWFSDSALPAKNTGDKVYFKVMATGNNNDISETYKFMYEVRGECDSEILSQTGADFKGVKSGDFLGLNADIGTEGNRVAIASRKYDYNGGTDNGLVQVFEQINNNWVQVGNDISGLNNQQLGSKVSMASNGARLAVAHKHNLDLTKVYELNGSRWVQLGNNINSNNAEVKLSADGNTLITSDWSDDTFGNNFGIVQVFEFDGTKWIEKGDAFSTTINSSVRFGKAIDIASNGNRIAVSSYYDGTHVYRGGSVTIFEWNESNRSWTSLGNTIYGTIPSANFGISLALNRDGSMLAIGAKRSNSAVYKLNENTWQQVGATIDPSFVLKDLLKIDISGDGKTVLLSNPSEAVDGNNNFGAVAKYQWKNEQWNKIGNTIYGNANNKYFGLQAALSKNGKTSIIGGYNSDYKGYAKIYKSECESQTQYTDLCGIDENTLLLLPFNGTFNNIINDENPLTLIGYNFAAGKYGYALSEYRSHKKHSLKYAANNHIDSQKGTVEAWIKPNWDGNDGKNHTLMQFGGGGGLLILKDGANNLCLIRNRFSPHNYPEIDVSVNIAGWKKNQWKHVAFTWGSGQLQLFIDGILVNQKDRPIPLYPISAAEFNIGTDNGEQIWDGAIDHLRISNSIRSQSEIIDFKNNCFRPKLASQANIEIFNFPNPFADRTTISYTLLKENPVTITVYNGMGKQVALLINQEAKQAGTHSVNFNGRNYPPGLYFYTVQAGDFIKTQKMILMR